MAAPRPVPTIALVAVPGAGDQRPGAGARGLADLLLRPRGGRGGRYSSFVEHGVRIPTRPARVNARSAPNVAPDLARSIFAEQHPFLRTQLQYGGAAARDREEDSPDHQLMRAQLADYRSAGDPYETVRLEGERLASGADGWSTSARVHVYEMRWSELSRPRPGFLRPLVELYQLALHLTHLGRAALDHARLEHPSSALWRACGQAHTWAVRLLTVFIPALCAATLMTLLGAAATTVPGSLLVDRIVLVASVLGAGGLIYLLFNAYERLRPGALPVGLGAYVLAATSAAFVAAGARSGDELLDGILHVFEVEAVVTANVWSAIYLLGALAGVLGLLARGGLRGPARDRARRAGRTAAATLAAGVTSGVVATFLLWLTVFRALETLLPEREFAPVVPAFRANGDTLAAFFESVLDVGAGAGLPVLLLGAAALALASVLALAPALRSEAGPRATSDAFDACAETAAAPPADAPVDTDALWAAWERFRAEGDASQRLGESTTRGLRALGAAAVLLYVVVFFAAPGVSAAHLLSGAPALDRVGSSADGVLLAASGLLVAAVAGVVVLRSRLGGPVLGLGSIVDVLLGVDDYLRTHPRDATPRARIAERYVSLLRHLCAWRDAAGRPYDAIVLVAHSQGAAITADLLSFIQREEDPELEPIRRPLANGLPGAAGRRLYLLTVGNPVRQLYSEWFPHLFGWVRGETGDAVARPLPAVPREPWMLLPRLDAGHRVSPPAIADAAAPDPYAMGITRWVNAYRSGDYVGRALWRPAMHGCEWIYRCAPEDAATRFPTDAPPVVYASEDAHRSRRELCIGAGAHTRYWDASATAVAVELDLIVTDAAQAAVRVAKDSGARAEGTGS